MKLKHDIDFTTLVWVKKELDETLKQAHQALESYVEDPSDSSQMRFCATYLHQVQGTLKMVELHGAAMVAEDMEKLALAILEDRVKQKEESYSVLLRGIVQLPDYLDRLQSGHRDVPIVLLPLLNDLRAVRDEKLISESSLFSPNLLDPLPNDLNRPPRRLPVRQHAKLAISFRPAYQFALVKWFNDDDPINNLKRLKLVCNKFLRITTEEAARRLWWAAEGVFEAAMVKKLDSSVSVKLVAGMVDREIRRIIEKGEADFASNPPVEIVKNLLYYVAYSDATSPISVKISQHYGLQELVPKEHELEHARGSLSGHNRELLDTVSKAIKEDLLSIKDALDLHLRNSDSATADLTPLTETLDSVADTLGMLGMGDPRQKVIDQRDLLLGITQGGQDIDEDTLMEIAGSLLYVESSLDDHIIHLGTPSKPQTEEDAGDDYGDLSEQNDVAQKIPQVDVRRILDALSSEAISNLQRAKHSIISFIESPWDHEQIVGVPQLCEEIVGALKMLHLEEPAKIVNGIIAYVASDLINKRIVPTAEQLDTLADAISSIEYYLEALRENRPQREEILRVAAKSVEALGYPDGKIVGGPTFNTDVEPSTNDVPTQDSALEDSEAEFEVVSMDLDEPEAASIDEPLEEIESLKSMDDQDELEDFGDLLDLDDLGDLADESPEQAEVEIADIGSLESIDELGSDELPEAIIETSPRQVIQVEKIKPADIPIPDFSATFDDDIDEDIREVFLEEVEEEVERVTEHYPKWKADKDNADSLTTLRRSFHTLKGSGRLVGAKGIGEFSWIVENLLNRVIDGLDIDDAILFKVMDRIIAVVPELQNSLSTGVPPQSNVAEVMMAAHHLEKGVNPFIMEEVTADPIEEPPIEGTASEKHKGIGATQMGGMDAVSELNFDELESASEELGSEPEAPTMELVPLDDDDIDSDSDELGLAIDDLALDSIGDIPADDDGLLSFDLEDLESNSDLSFEQDDTETDNDNEFVLTLDDMDVEESSDEDFDELISIDLNGEDLPEPNAVNLSDDISDLEDILGDDGGNGDGVDWDLDISDDLKKNKKLAQSTPNNDSNELLDTANEDADTPPVALEGEESIRSDSPLEEELGLDESDLTPIELGIDQQAIDGLLNDDPIDANSDSNLVGESDPLNTENKTVSKTDDTDLSFSHVNALIDDNDQIEVDEQGVLSESLNRNTQPLDDEIIDDLDFDDEDDALDPVLCEIFRKEADGHLKTIRDYCEAQSAQTEPEAVDANLHKAFHTLNGAASMAGVTSISDVAHPLESYFKRLFLLSSAPNQEGFETLADVLNLFEETVENLQPGVAKFPHPTELMDRVEVLLKALPEIEESEKDLLVLETQLSDDILNDDRFSIDDGVPLENDNTVDSVSADTPSDQPEAAATDITVEEPVNKTEESKSIHSALPEDASFDHEHEDVDILGADFPQEYFNLGEDSDDELLEIFLQEGAEILDASDGIMQRWRAEPENIEPVAGLQRELHTLKGGARMAGVSPVGDLSHVMESLFESIVGGEIIDVPDRAFSALEGAFDQLHSMLEHISKKKAFLLPNARIAELNYLVTGEVPHELLEDASASTAKTSKKKKTKGQQSSPHAATSQAKPSLLDRQTTQDKEEATGINQGARQQQELVRVRADLLDNLVNYAGEVSIYRSRLEQQVGSFRFNLVELDQTVTRLREQLRNLELETETQILSRFKRESEEMDEDFDPLEMDRFSTLQQLSRALAESVSDLVSIQDLLDDLTRQSETLLLQQSRVNADLQEGLMRTRMVPFSSLVPRLRRILRQTSAELGKQAQLEVKGAEGEMDRTVLDRITAPLEHMLRNALAHGLETPEERLQAGKGEQGTITLEIKRESSEVLINVSDDGKGINLAAVRKQAIDRGLLTKSAKLNDREIMSFILETGFSTATEISKIAGRGVGMDVVHSEIKQLSGSLDIDSVAGKGTRFEIRLPFTLAITNAIMILVGDATYAVPISSIVGVVRTPRKEFEDCVNDQDGLVEYGNEHYAIQDLSLLMGSDATQNTDEAHVPLLMVKVGGQRTAFLVERLMGSREIVVKSMGPQVSSVPGIFGATILGDGSVVLILDLAPFARKGALITPQTLEMDASMEAERVLAEEEDRLPLVMVVDDSITMRKVTSRMLERNSMESITAKDGVDAVAVLHDTIPDAMLLDIEMPRMDGFELATHIRNEARLKHIPIIMITSRTGEKHRQKAMDIGVDRYLGKPYQEAELLSALNEVLGLEESVKG